MKLTLGFSPCPNDTYIFDAMIHQKVDTEGLEFDAILEDVETLNNYAFNKALNITKLSFHAFAYAVEHYELLDAGSALGFGVGPLLISKYPYTLENLQQNNELRVAIPGKYTTANFLLDVACPQLRNKLTVNFSAIEGLLLEEKADLGVIIHENRFTYAQKGLHKIIDLGSHWEALTGLPIPLGGIVIDRSLPHALKLKVNRVLKRSVAFAFENPTSGLDYIRKHAQEMDDAVMFQHIKLYVNKHTLNLGTEGKQAIDELFKIARNNGTIPTTTKQLYLA